MRVVACFASSLDGKISLSEMDRYVRLSSDEDIHRLKSLRDEAEAIVMGGKTFRAYPKVHRGINPSRQNPLHVILTRDVSLILPSESLFQVSPSVPVWIISSVPVDPFIQSHFSPSVQWYNSPAKNPVPFLLNQLEQAGVQTVLVEGGGEIFSLFLQARAVDELYLTLCPLLIGGSQSPGLLGGGLLGKSVPDLPRTEILSLSQVDQEIFLHLQLIYPQN